MVTSGYLIIQKRGSNVDFDDVYIFFKKLKLIKSTTVHLKSGCLVTYFFDIKINIKRILQLNVLKLYFDF